MTLLRNGGTPYLIHTAHTQQQAGYLANLLNQEVFEIKSAQTICLGNRHSNAFQIRQCIQELAESLPGRFGLNYTGGTKEMAKDLAQLFDAPVKCNPSFHCSALKC